MSLTRVWTPTSNYSSGGQKRLLCIHSMEGFTGANGAYDCAKYFQGDVGASSQVCIDNNRGKIWECVDRGYGSWTQCQYNSVSVSMEQSGYASWSRDYWLTNRSNQLHNVADWIAEESRKLGIPIKRLSASEAQGGSWGICSHSDLGPQGCGHGDPGAGWPWDVVLDWAKGGSSATGGEFMAASTADGAGRLWHACIWTDGKVNVKPPDQPWRAVDMSQSGAKGGADISYVPKDDMIVITYINGAGNVCTYHQPATGGGFTFTNRGGEAKG